MQFSLLKKNDNDYNYNTTKDVPSSDDSAQLGKF